MTTSTSSPTIGPSDRVSDVLARDERLVDVFVHHAPHFEKLRSPAMRRVMARLVTVEQAARIAGVGADILVRDLNAALDATDARHAAAPPRRSEAPTESRSATRPAELHVVELDVRDDLRVGREPFSRILAAVSALDDDQALRLRTIFEPLPLFAVLARRGFSHESRQDGLDDWSVWFWRASSERDVGVQIPRLAALARDDNQVWLDVRGLEPPQPMLRTLAALETLPEGHELVQINARVPLLLLPVLVERGYACEVDESRTDRVLVRIWRADRR